MPFCQSKADVEDLVSRAIERAVGNVAKYNAEKGNLFSWVRTILVNLALDDARAREIRKTYSCDMDELANDEAMATSATDERILASSDEEVLRAAINRLAPEYKKTVIMHYLMDMPLKEIAKVLHRPIGTVKWRLSVAKDVLAGMLKKTLGRPGTWIFLALGLITGCVATSCHAPSAEKANRSGRRHRLQYAARPRNRRPSRTKGDEDRRRSFGMDSSSLRGGVQSAIRPRLSRLDTHYVGREAALRRR